ncbi:MAG: universal stress protein [Anaerolineales bacterium]|nr:universal stress protein [Anaerolineales bacterium]MDW8447301.1 universal stress protein [Anaerolineales bacterium]
MKVRAASQPLRIIFGDDGSEHAYAAAKLICDLPLPSGSEVIALAVFPPTRIDHYPTIKEQLEATCEHLRDRGISIQSEVKAGDPAETILDMAVRRKANLVVVGAVGLRATLGIFLGGVAQKVVEYGHCPVLVVRAPYQGLHHVLLANDGSEYGWKAVDYLCSFPLPQGVRLSALHVLPPLYPEDYATAAWGMGKGPLPVISAARTATTLQKSEEEEAGERVLVRTLELLKQGGYKTESFLRRGDAATEILQFAKEKQVDLIVAGSRGLSPVSAWLLGSVSRKLIHYGKCSVLTVRLP